MVVGVNVQPPHQLFFPGGERARTDRLDIHERHQAEHLEPLLGPDERGELAHHNRVLGITLKGGTRHLQVLCDQELDDVTPFVRHPKALQHRPRHPHALLGVTLVLPLADIVVEQRQDQQLRRMQFVENRLDPLPPRHTACRDAFNAANGQQRVLVNGVLVVEVANNQTRHGPELREIRRQ